MKTKWFAIGGAVLVAAAAGIVVVKVRRNAAATRNVDATTKLDTQIKQVSYAMGVAMARSLQKPDVAFDADLLASGMKDAFSGKELLMGEDALRKTMTALEDDLKQKQSQALKATADANKKRGEAFLAENAKVEGVIKLPSGLQYKVLGKGDGKKPTDGDTVECHYRGIRLDGKEFQSSYARGQTATFPIASTIPGWREALKLMNAGSKWKLFVPAQLAYGERGVPGKNGAALAIGPNESLIFEVDFLAIKPAVTPREGTAVAKARAD